MFRHGQTTFNRDGRFTGWLNVYLTRKGREQARKVARKLKKEKFDGVTRPSTDTYRKRWDEIFKPKTLHEELMEGYEEERKELFYNCHIRRGCS